MGEILRVPRDVGCDGTGSQCMLKTNSSNFQMMMNLFDIWESPIQISTRRNVILIDGSLTGPLIKFLYTAPKK
jgi:hypothetical protein